LLQSTPASGFQRRHIGWRQLNRIPAADLTADQDAAQSAPLPVQLPLQTHTKLVHPRTRLARPGDFEHRVPDLQALAPHQGVYTKLARGDVLPKLAGQQAKALNGFALDEQHLPPAAGTTVSTAFQTAIRHRHCLFDFAHGKPGARRQKEVHDLPHAD
jgi:hypothetical protein